MAKEVWINKDITLIGPKVLNAEASIDGRNIFYGSLYLYSTLLLALVFNWNPLIISESIVVLQFVAIVLASWILSKRIGRRAGVAFFLICASFPIFINFSNFIWNPNYGIILSFLSIFAIELVLKKRKPIYILLLGFLTGISLQFHYLYWLVIPFYIFFIFRKFKTMGVASFLLGIGIGNFPFFLFELRNNFYITRTGIDIINKLVNQNTLKGIPEHYYGIFLPYVFYLVMNLLFRQKKYRNLSIGLLLGFGLLLSVGSLRRTLSEERFGVLPYWGYQDQLRAVGIIASQNEEYYNIANLIYGDTREYPVRFLLEQKGQKIMPVDAYARTNTLYVISKDNPLGHDVWELDSIKPANTIKIWEINPDVKLYKIERIKKI